MRLLLCAVLGAVLVLSPAWGQTKPVAAPVNSGDDKYVDALLAQSAITWDNASWLVGRAVGTFDESVTPTAAAAKASAEGWAPGPIGSADALDLAGYSLLLVQAVKIPGGLFYSLFPGPRYAYRELVFRKIIPGTLAPDMPVTGEAAMRYLQAAQDWKEAQK